MFQQVKPNPFAIPQAPVGIEPTQFNLPKPKSGGMFGGGGDWKTALAAALAGFAAGGGNPAAAQTLQALHMNRMQKQRQEQDEQQYQRKQSDDWNMWQRQKQWERDNPAPRVNDTVADYEFFKGQLGEDAAKDFLRSKTNPVVMTPYGPMPYSAVVPQQAKPLTDDDILRMQGGAGQSAPRPF